MKIIYLLSCLLCSLSILLSACDKPSNRQQQNRAQSSQVPSKNKFKQAQRKYDRAKKAYEQIHKKHMHALDIMKQPDDKIFITLCKQNIPNGTTSHRNNSEKYTIHSNEYPLLYYTHIISHDINRLENSMQTQMEPYIDESQANQQLAKKINIFISDLHKLVARIQVTTEYKMKKALYHKMRIMHKENIWELADIQKFAGITT